MLSETFTLKKKRKKIMASKDEEVSLLTDHEAAMCGYVIQAAIPDASFTVKKTRMGDWAHLVVNIPGSAPDWVSLGSTLEVGRYLKKHKELL